MLASASSREEAEAIVIDHFPQLEIAAAEGKFEEEFSVVKTKLRAQVRWSCVLLASIRQASVALLITIPSLVTR